MLLAIPRVANAGRTHYGWLYGTEVLPERGTEIQTWIFEKNGMGLGNLRDNAVRQTHLWWGGFIGVTDHLELVFPSEWLWEKIDGNDAATFTLEKFGIEARYRFAKTDPEKPDGIVPLLRVAAKRDVSIRDVGLLEADLVVSYQSGPFHGLVDLGYAGRISKEDGLKSELRPGVGVAIEVKPGLRFGAEAYGELPLDSEVNKQRWFGVGPNISWTHGRFWLSASLLVGVYQIETAPRAIWGIMF
jgi:hypothetical protein